MASGSKRVPVGLPTSASNEVRICNVCKTLPMGKNEHIMHILGKKHVKNIKSKTLAMMLNDEAERSVHVSQYTANTTAEAIVNAFWKFGVRHVHYTKSYTFVEFDSASGAKDAMKGKHNINGKNIVVAPKRKLSSHGDKNEEFTGLPLSTMLTSNIRRLNNPIEIENLIPRLMKEIEVNDYRSRENIRLGMEMVLRQHFPDVRAYVFGSSANNLGFRGCDVDLYVELGYDPWASGIKNVMEKNAADVTWYIARLVKKERIGYNVQAVPRARVPIVKFREWHSGIYVDVSFKNGMPVYNTELICQYTQTHELVRPYLMIIRYWAKIQGIAGGAQPASLITNYAFTMMMLWYLMYRTPPILPTVAALKNCSGNHQNNVISGWDCSFSKNVNFWKERRHNVTVMELIQEFFSFYGDVDLEKYVISPLSGNLVQRKAVKEKSYKDLPSSFSTYLIQGNELQIDTPICVQDPFDHAHNVTRGLREGPLKVFQYKCRRATKICEDVLNGALPLDALLSKINITPETMVEIFPDDEEEEVPRADPDDSIEILDDSTTNLDTSANSSIAEVITLNDTVESVNDSMDEEVSIISHEGKNGSNETGQKLSGGDKSKTPPIITLELPPEEEALKFPLDFANVPQFSLQFDGTIDGQITEAASNEKEVAFIASNLVHFVLQECLQCNVEVLEAPLDKNNKGRKRELSDEETEEPSKRIKGEDGASAGVANKYRRVAKYRCKMDQPLWVGRKKISKQVPPTVNETPLQHEKTITKAQLLSIAGESSNGVILQCSVSLWQEVESPSSILVTVVSTSSAKVFEALIFIIIKFFKSQVLSLVN
ncbi:unnamed protein product, partial [Meganyctiphanes norvegica]